MKSHTAKPDTFALGLFCVGVLMFFLPLMRMAGIIALLAALGYWITMVVVRTTYRRRD